MVDRGPWPSVSSILDSGLSTNNWRAANERSREIFSNVCVAVSVAVRRTVLRFGFARYPGGKMEVNTRCVEIDNADFHLPAPRLQRG